MHLSRKIAQLHKENTAPPPPPLAQIIQQSNQQRSLLSGKAPKRAHNNRNSTDSSGGTTSVVQSGATATANGNSNGSANQRKRLSMSDVSDMLFEFYRANVAKAPKTQTQQQQQQQQPNKFGGQTSPTSAETLEPSTIAAIATNGAAVVQTDAASKNLQSDEMLAANGTAAVTSQSSSSNNNGSAAAFHPRIKYTNKSAGEGAVVKVTGETAGLTAIPTSVAAGPSSSQVDDDQLEDVKPLINPATGLIVMPAQPTASSSLSVIKPVPGVITATAVGVVGGSAVVPQAAAIAAALLRDGYHSFQQQLRAQEILKHQVGRKTDGGTGCATGGVAHVSSSNGGSSAVSADGTPTKILESFLRQQQQQQQQQLDDASDSNDGDNDDDEEEEDDGRYNGFEDIHLVEGGGGASKLCFGNQSLPNLFVAAANSNSNSSPGGGALAAADYLSDESQKFMIAAQARALRNLEYSLSDFGATPGGGGDGPDASPNGSIAAVIGADGEPVYECRHCGKKYRWKSTLRRHENVECGGKEPSHQCPYCPYKSKQRGNLGVHVRKHHSNLPQLASKRRSKYSQKLDGSGGGTGGASDDSSSSKLIIDCSK